MLITASHTSTPAIHIVPWGTRMSTPANAGLWCFVEFVSQLLQRGEKMTGRLASPEGKTWR